MVRNKFELWEILNFAFRGLTDIKMKQFMNFRKHLNLNNFYSILKFKSIFTDAELCFFSLLLQNCCKITLKMIQKSARLQADVEQLNDWSEIIDQNELISKVSELFVTKEKKVMKQ